MKIALLISGFLRSFEYNIDSILNTIGLENNIDLYLHISSSEYENDKYVNNKINIKTIKEKYKPKAIVIEDELEVRRDLLQNKTRYASNTIRMWNKIHLLNMLKCRHEKSNHFKYDIVIRMRPDIHILNNQPLNYDKFELKDNAIYIPEGFDICNRSKLENEDDKYVNDQFALGNSTAMNTYCQLFEQIKSYSNDNVSFISEVLLHHHLQCTGLNVVRFTLPYKVILGLCNIIAITGNSGSGKTYLSGLLQSVFKQDLLLMEGDRYHKWERGDKRWKSMTHLHPEANYISKMSKDMFDLKIGNEIFQVDYDHSNGKFTKAQKIESKDNVILCGLHSLYDNDTNHILNLKIFVHPQTELNYVWKIHRDMSQRGYDYEKVMQSIRQREDDYNTYILPQLNKADIVIQFYTNHELYPFDKNWIIKNMDNIPQINLKLKVMFHNEIACKRIMLLLNTRNIEFDYEYKSTLYFDLNNKDYDDVLKFVIYELSRII